MADSDEDEGFLDDDLDGLTSDDFLLLQQQALQATQHQRVQDPHSLPSTAGVPLRQKDHYGFGNATSQQQAESFPTNPSSDYGDLDDEVLDAGLLDSPKVLLAGRQPRVAPVIVGQSTQREQWRQQRFAGPQQPHGMGQQPWGGHVLQGNHLSQWRGANGQDVKENERDSDEEEMLDRGPDVPVPKSYTGRATGSSGALEAKVAELLLERENLQQAVQAANDQLYMKAGEISIVRANQAKAQKDFEKQLKELTKQNADIATKHRAELEHAKVEREKLATEKKYLQHDLQEENERAKKLQRVVKSAVAGKTASHSNGIIITPKKAKALPFRELRDGFDDDEIMSTSPSKTPGKSKPLTPKGDKKRKWKSAGESPSQPLELNQNQGEIQLYAPSNIEAQTERPAERLAISKPDQRFQFTQKLLNHRLSLGERRSFEALADFAYPSRPNTMLSTLLLDKMALLSSNQNMADFSTSMASIMVTLWAQCIAEKYYKPLRLLLDLVWFILMSSHQGTGPHLMDEVVGLAQKTADINVIPRFKRFAPAATSRAKEDLLIEGDVDTRECLSILYLIASACARKQEDIARFWRLMRFDFIMMVCRNSQPVEDVHLILKILNTSVQENTFAMITDPAKQRELERHVIDRISAMLIEVPRASEGEEPYDTVDVAEMRLRTVGLLEKLCDKRHGGEALAKHPLVVGRLVRVMNDELNALYDHKAGHEHRAALVNRTTRVLYYLTSTYPGNINIQEKLRAHPGGVYKHLIVLTRLAFSDGLFYEQGIEDDVVDCAHQMLEDTVTPEEGEALLEVFSSAKK